MPSAKRVGTRLFRLLWGPLLFCVGCQSNTTSNECIRVADSVLQTDEQGLKFIEVTLVFRKRVTGQRYSDKPANIFTQLRRYGEMPDKTTLYYFDSVPSAKVFVDLYDSHGKLIRTDGAYYDEYMPFQAAREIAEILPGEQKTMVFGVPKEVASYRVWVVEHANRKVSETAAGVRSCLA